MDSKEERKGNLIKQGEEQNCPEKEKEKKRVTQVNDLKKHSMAERSAYLNVGADVCVMSTL